jgi:hypothetical protein
MRELRILVQETKNLGQEGIYSFDFCTAETGLLRYSLQMREQEGQGH